MKIQVQVEAGNKMGLTPEEHQQLNKPKHGGADVKKLKEKYQGDITAQQQLNRYQGGGKAHRTYIRALKSGDDQRASFWEKILRRLFGE